MVKSVSFSSVSKNTAVAVMFRLDEWDDDPVSLYMKHKLLAGDEHSNKVSCEYYIFSAGLESKELYVRWRLDIHI